MTATAGGAKPKTSALGAQVRWKATAGLERLSAASLGKAPAGVHLGVVLAGWDPDRTVASVEALRDHLSLLAVNDYSMVVVANHPSVAARVQGMLNDGIQLITGSNEEGEFSAYDEGRRHLTAQADPAPDVWAIANDRLPAYGTRYVRAVDTCLLRLMAAAPIVSGHMDAASAQGRGPSGGELADRHAIRIKLWDHVLSCYLRSNWLLVSNSALQRVGGFTSVTSAEYGQHVPLEFPGAWPLADWLGQEMAEWLRIWLTEPGNWERAEPLTARSWPVLRQKALAVVNEHLLSARLAEARIPLLPWRQAWVLSHLDPRGELAAMVLRGYGNCVGLGKALQDSPRARSQLAAAVIAARLGLGGTAVRAWRAASRSVGAAIMESGPESGSGSERGAGMP
jgi:hypothetical protein